MEEYCRGHELLWLCPDSVNIARLVVGGVIDLVKENIEERVGNGFAIVRPPGHHSYGKLPQGFCIFNNVSIAAKFAVERLNVLVFDVDYHCGNGNYHSLKGDNRFLLVNFHAYHHGAFWPYEEEYDYDNKYTNVVSIPLNAAMNSEGDYFAAMKHLVIPIANEFAPELVLVSLGFDSAYYDDLLEHGQGIKAHGYGHMMKLLHENWPNKVLAVLEGGYFSLSYTECAVMATKGLKGLALPRMEHPKYVNPCMVETIWNCLCHQAKTWRAAACHLQELQLMQVRYGLPRYKPPAVKLFVGTGFRYIWNRVQELKIARTRDWIPGMSDADKQLATEKILEYIKEYDYSNKTTELSEKEFLEQLLWNSERAGQAFLLSIPITLWYYEGMKNCLESESNKYLIIDMYAYRRANAMLRKTDSVQEGSSTKRANV
uniref:Histone deacetylase domain-containing protein n=1 Tax=Ascaris lumbricoides TaxID=6252 RepID=A0A9J2Q9L0_ASCLU